MDNNPPSDTRHHSPKVWTIIHPATHGIEHKFFTANVELIRGEDGAQLEGIEIKTVAVGGEEFSQVEQRKGIILIVSNGIREMRVKIHCNIVEMYA